MKVIKTKLIQKCKGRKKGKYHLTLEVTDYDLEMIEKFALTMTPFEVIEECSEENNFNGKYSTDYKKKYQRWMDKTWRCFWKCWNDYDEY